MQPRQAGLTGIAEDWRSSMWVSRLLVAVGLGAVVQLSLAHPGGLDAKGCHTNRKTGDYHCHRAQAPVAQQTVPAPAAPAASPPVAPAARSLPPGCHVGPRGGTYTITKSGKKNYSGC